METPVPETPADDRHAWLGAFARLPFAVVWVASTIALVGISIYDTGSGWLMTTLDLNPLDVSLVHVATSLPMFLFTLPAGALADIVDPRRLILWISCGIAVLIVMFAALVSVDLASPLSLLMTTFLLSAAWSVNSPAWLAILPSLVAKSELPGAIAANGVAYNLSRTIGPALGGFAIVHYGLSAPYWVFAVANVVVIAALLWWRAPPKETASLPAERLSGAVRTGVRHAINNRYFRATMIRTLAVYPFTAAYTGLMPLIARNTGTGAEHYGVLLSMISAGALAGSFGHRFLRRFVNLDWMAALGSVGTAAALALFGSSTALPVLLGACFCAGAAWVLVLTSLYVSAQNVLPQWVRGRGLAIFLTVIFGVSAVSSAAWGQAAAKYGLELGAPRGGRGGAHRHSGHLALAAARLRSDRSHALSPLPAARGGGADRRRPRTGPGEDRVLDRSEGSRPVPARDRRTGRAAPPRRRVRLGRVRGHGRVRPVRRSLLDRIVA